ncbi:hypothetical protein AB0M20_05885 [Actinoplanes sp. NPDC051633]|uniref:Rv0361 family membrane protein n=1 Tax=Actinoplanes sp. NPDC051633 TaxID=3155670 RepID=UPI0034353AB9
MQPPLAPPPPAGKRPNRRVRLWIAMGAGILALLCLGGVGVFISVYDQATEIKRTAPDAVVDSYLGAFLQNRDDEEAALYVCKSGANLSALQAFRARFMAVEKDQSVGIDLSWTSISVTVVGDRATASTDLKWLATDGAHGLQPFRFGLVDKDGWRVCSATSTG